MDFTKIDSNYQHFFIAFSISRWEQSLVWPPFLENSLIAKKEVIFTNMVVSYGVNLSFKQFSWDTQHG